MKRINKKVIVISLILLTALSVTVGALLVNSTASASSSTNSTTSNATTSIGASTSALSEVNQTMGMQPFGGFMALGGQQFGAGQGDQGRMSMGGTMGTQNIEISSAYNETIYSILTNDTDVANLLSEGYNVTAIHPILHSVIGGDGTVTTQASTATVLLQKGDTGYATVTVDVTNDKVTHIVIVTETVIDK